MDDREKENREYEEFLKTFGGRYGSEQETAKAVTATNLPQKTKQNEPQEKNADIPVSKEPQKIAAGNEKGRTTASQPSKEQAKHFTRASRKPSEKAHGRRKTIGLICAAIAVIIAAAVLIARFGSTDALKGTWDLDGVTVYEFNGKGAGSLNLPSNSYAFTYEIKNGTLAIDFESEAARDTTYTFTADKNKLTLTDGEGTDSKTFELTKQKD